MAFYNEKYLDYIDRYIKSKLYENPSHKKLMLIKIHFSLLERENQDKNTKN